MRGFAAALVDNDAASEEAAHRDAEPIPGFAAALVDRGVADEEAARAAGPVPDCIAAPVDREVAAEEAAHRDTEPEAARDTDVILSSAASPPSDEEDWMEEMVAALELEEANLAASEEATLEALELEEASPGNALPKSGGTEQEQEEKQMSHELPRPQQRKLGGAEEWQLQQWEHHAQALEERLAALVAEQECKRSTLQEGLICDLPSHVARALKIAKPPPVRSFAEMWCFRYLLRTAAPRAPPRTGHLSAEVGDLWLVVGRLAGGICVQAERHATSAQLPMRLAPCSLVWELGFEDGLLKYELLTGAGPTHGWVSTRASGQELLVKVAAGTRLEVEQSSGQNIQSWAPQRQGRLREPGTCLHCKSRIPVGGLVCVGLEGQVLQVHHECVLKLMCKAQRSLCSSLEELQEAKEVREEQEQALMKSWHMDHKIQETLRKKHAIGWREELVPSNVGPAQRLGFRLEPQGLCALRVDEAARSIRLARIRTHGYAVNLAYLSLALKAQQLEGGEPTFSLDPLDPKDPESMLRKSFGPAWLGGTSAGEVLFQADYYLKELSMGQFEQPIAGMTSIWDFVDGFTLGPDWNARIWICVRESRVDLSADDVLMPWVKMGVEARELNCDSYEDAAVTRPDHPLVKYAEIFERNFDAIAERESVFYHLRELARAVALSKFLTDNSYSVGSEWLDLAGTAKECSLNVPTLWNHRFSSEANLPAALELVSQEGRTRTLFGGVDLSLRPFLAPKRLDTSLRIDDASDIPSSSERSSSSDVDEVGAAMAGVMLSTCQLPGVFVY